LTVNVLSFRFGLKTAQAALSEKDFRALKASSFQSKTIGLNLLVEQEFFREHHRARSGPLGHASANRNK
jgi:hypothetical protein